MKGFLTTVSAVRVIDCREDVEPLRGPTRWVVGDRGGGVILPEILLRRSFAQLLCSSR